MTKPHFFRLLLIAAAAVVSLFLTAADAGEYSSWTSINSPATCRGSIAECMADDTGEFDMDSESNRRILATKKYLGYDALKRNRVPCSRRGASYYNCRSNGQANPYTRTCSVATKCRR